MNLAIGPSHRCDEAVGDAALGRFAEHGADQWVGHDARRRHIRPEERQVLRRGQADERVDGAIPSLPIVEQPS